MANYATKKFDKEHMARVMGRNLPISFKQTVEVCNFIRGRSINNSKAILSDVLGKKVVVPFKRFNRDLGHKKKAGAGRFPVKVSKELIKLLDGVEANAQFKGLDTSNLIITHICAHKGSRMWHYGRKRRREMKRTNIEIIVEEKMKEESKELKSKAQEEIKKPKSGVETKKPEAKEKND
jgi:large subunit ribosomal protein L22